MLYKLLEVEDTFNKQHDIIMRKTYMMISADL